MSIEEQLVLSTEGHMNYKWHRRTSPGLQVFQEGEMLWGEEHYSDSQEAVGFVEAEQESSRMHESRQEQVGDLDALCGPWIKNMFSVGSAGTRLGVYVGGRRGGGSQRVGFQAMEEGAATRLEDELLKGEIS